MALPRGAMGLSYLQFVIVVFPDHTHLLFLTVVTEQSILFAVFLQNVQVLKIE